MKIVYSTQPARESWCRWHKNKRGLCSDAEEKRWGFSKESPPVVLTTNKELETGKANLKEIQSRQNGTATEGALTGREDRSPCAGGRNHMKFNRHYTKKNVSDYDLNKSGPRPGCGHRGETTTAEAPRKRKRTRARKEYGGGSLETVAKGSPCTLSQREKR